MKDFYNILKISSTATRKEIKEAYRKIALKLHPDQTGGCEIKSAEFKVATEAYETLYDQRRRSTYDNTINKNKPKRPLSPNYRKVYSPRPPPGFKIFDPIRHKDMHYGSGMMREAIENIRRRQKGKDLDENEYVSPLGRGFKFEGGKASGGAFTRRKENKYEYEEGYMDMNSTSKTRRILDKKEIVRMRMKNRRKERIKNQSEKKETRWFSSTWFPS